MLKKTKLATLKEKADKALDSAKGHAGSAVTKFKESEAGSAILEKGRTVYQKADQAAETSGAKTAYRAVADKTSDTFDSISGEKIRQVLLERLDGQDQLNDLLAAKLHDALQRIDALERAQDATRKME